MATLNNTVGAIFFGTSVSCIVFGITIVQTYLYYCNFPKDWMLFKVSVGVLITLATFHLTVTLHAAHYYLITNFDHPSGLKTMIWSFRLQVIINALVVVIVQSLYALRVWKLGGRFSKFWPTLVVLIVVGGLGLGIYGVVISFKITGFAQDENKPIVFSGFLTTTTIDVVIAFAMCYYLNKSRSSFTQTNNVIFVVVRYVLISGFLTSACSLSALIAYLVMPRSLVFISIDFLLPNLYINSYMAMLNARIWINEREVPPVSPISTAGTNICPPFTGTLPPDSAGVVHLSTVKRGCSRSNKYDLERNILPKHIGIVVHRTEERTYDRHN